MDQKSEQENMAVEERRLLWGGGSGSTVFSQFTAFSFCTPLATALSRAASNQGHTKKSFAN